MEDVKLRDTVGDVGDTGSMGLEVTSALYSVLGQNVTTTLESSVQDGSFSCETIDANYDIATSVVCALCFLLGILYTFAGYRCFRLVMFLTGFLTISILVYMVCLEVTSLKPLVIAGISLAAGLVAGLLTMCVQYIGFICAGFNLGFLISSAILIGVEQFYHLVTIWIPVGFILAVGTVFAILTLKFQKAFTIMQTSVFGGVLMISCIDYFIEQFLLMSYTWNTVRAEESWTPCWYSWIILGCWPFCFVVGTLAQWKITGHTYDHSQESSNRHCYKFRLKRSAQQKEKPKENPHQSRYRHLYQARRANGDVISQNYIQTIQSKLSPSLRNMTRVPTEPQAEPESTNTTLTQIPEA